MIIFVDELLNHKHQYLYQLSSQDLQDLPIKILITSMLCQIVSRKLKIPKLSFKYQSVTKANFRDKVFQRNQ